MYLGFRLPLVVPLATLASDLRSRGRVCVIVEAPSQWRKIEPRGFSNLIGRAGSIGGHQVGGCHRRTRSCLGGELGPTSCGRRCTGEGGIVGCHLGRWINCLHLGPLR